MLLEQAQENTIWLAVAVGLAALALLAAWKWLPRGLRRFFDALDRFVPLDFGVLKRSLTGIGLAVFVGCVLTGLSVSLAHSLGADTSGITEALTRFGGDAGQWLRDRALKVLLILAIALLAIRTLKRLLPYMVGNYLRQRGRIGATEEEAEKRATTLQNVASRSAEALIIVVAAFMVLSELGIDIAPLLASAGVVGIAIGFGAQNVVRDTLAGAFIIMEDQFRVGDVVEIAGSSGQVEDINLRRTVLRDLEFIVHVIPNGEIRTVRNMTKSKSRMMIDVSVAYKEDLDRCIAVINDVGREMQEDLQWGVLITEQIHVLWVNEFGGSSIDIRVLGETLPMKQWDVGSEFRRRIKRRFDAEGIEIPFPHTTLYWGVDQPPFHRPDQEPAPPLQSRPAGRLGRKRAWGPERFRTEMQKHSDARVRAAGLDILDFARANREGLLWGREQSYGAFGYRVQAGQERLPLFTYYTTGAIDLNLGRVRGGLPEEALQEFVESVAAIPGFDGLPQQVEGIARFETESSLIDRASRTKFKAAVRALQRELGGAAKAARRPRRPAPAGVVAAESSSDGGDAA